MTTPTHILLIDGDAPGRGAVVAGLAASNLTYTLVEAETAQAGLDAAKAEAFDCVLLDSRLPGVALPEYLARLTSVDGGRHAVVALTNEADHDDTLSLLRAGALDSLTRSEINAHTLARAVRYAKARRGFVVELQAAREDAEEKSRALDRLNRQTTLILSIIAHDLRNPFQVLLGMSEILVASAKSGDREKLERRAASTREAAAQASSLLESLFAWASLHMDARAEPAKVALAALFAESAEAMRESADAKGVRLVAEPTDAHVVAQAAAVAAILRNLLANAVKFTGAGGEVKLASEVRDGAVAVCVSDSGVGMSEAQAAALFQVESRATSRGTDGESGAGLGLLLCRDLAEWVGGVLEVQTQLGHGTTFRLVLPTAT